MLLLMLGFLFDIFDEDYGSVGAIRSVSCLSDQRETLIPRPTS